MDKLNRPFIYQLIRQAAEALPAPLSYTDIINFIHRDYPEVPISTIRAQIIVCTVNHDSRIHYPENRKPRPATDARYDFLFRKDKGIVELYDPKKHGEWEIVKNMEPFPPLKVQKIQETPAIAELPEEPPATADAPSTFAFVQEKHLQEFIAQNLDNLSIRGKQLTLYANELGTELGIEFDTRTVGRIDILTTDEEGNFVVFELKRAKSPDDTVGQLTRYMGWVQQHLAKSKKVSGVIVARQIDKRLKYAALVIPDVTLLEYEMKFDLKEVVIK